MSKKRVVERLAALYAMEHMDEEHRPEEEVLRMTKEDAGDNLQAALNLLGVWDDEWKPARDWSPKNTADTVELYGDQLPPLPMEGDIARGVYPRMVTCDPPLPDGSAETFLLLSVNPKKDRGPGRPKTAVSAVEREQIRQKKIAAWKRKKKWTMADLEALKRHDLVTLAAHVGIHDPSHKGGNEALRGAIAKRLGVRR